MKALDIANYAIWYANQKFSSVQMTPLKLQKILYYISVVYSRKYNRLPFDGKIQKWQFGPVVSEVYEEFKSYGASAIKKPAPLLEVRISNGSFSMTTKEFNLNDYNSELTDVIESVVDDLINVPPFELVEKTHLDDAWLLEKTKILAGERNLEYTLDEIKSSKYPNYL